jgi:ribonuclease BN (tRNA processing enzyme)
MRVRVLGCSGAIAANCRTTSFWVNHNVLIDAGTGVGDLTMDEMCGIEHVFLTHSHLDHIAALPLMVDTCASRLRRPIKVYALAETLQSLKNHIFNNVIWPDFTVIPSREQPFVSFHPIAVGQILKVADDVFVECLPAVHTVPACGFAVRTPRGDWVFSGDTERNAAFWGRINQLKVKHLVIETAFSDREAELARLSKHLSPRSLAKELDLIDKQLQFPVYITHTKPSETDLIMDQVHGFDETDVFGSNVRHDIRELKHGQEFNI